MNSWIDYLSSNPLLLLALVVVLVLFFIMVFRKLLKWAIISFIILAIAIGWTYRNSQKPEVIKDLEKKAEQLIEKGKKEAEKFIEEKTNVPN
jgi:uncharacterized SAM-binding protein YcdF (DUF218 family)